MKFLLLFFLFSIFFILNAYSQSDTLVIKKKNNQIEKISISEIRKIQFENITGVNGENNTPDNLQVNGNFPNPFQRQTNIEFEIAETGNVVVFIYDNAGNQIQKLEYNSCHAGKNILMWNGLDKDSNPVHSGVYFYRVHFNNEVQSNKMIIIK